MSELAAKPIAMVVGFANSSTRMSARRVRRVRACLLAALPARVMSARLDTPHDIFDGYEAHHPQDATVD